MTFLKYDSMKIYDIYDEEIYDIFLLKYDILLNNFT